MDTWKLFFTNILTHFLDNTKTVKRGAVVQWLKMLNNGEESRRKDMSSNTGFTLFVNTVVNVYLFRIREE